MDGWQAFSQMGIFSVGSVSIAWIVKKLFIHQQNKEIEKYKNELNKETEKYKSELQILTSEHEKIFSILHTERANAVKELYARLVSTERAMLNWASPIRRESNENLQAEADKAGATLKKYYDANRIFFTPELCNVFESLFDKLGEAWFDYTTYSPEATLPDLESMKERGKLMLKAWNTVSKEVPVIREKIEKEFRSILGVQGK